MKFIDVARIQVKAGDGGAGCVSFHREKFVPLGGPDGGDGGKGGDVVFCADRSISTLLNFQHRKRYEATRGANGGRNNCSGRNGEDLEVRVPEGTIVFDAADGGIVCDLGKAGQRAVVARGGAGGRGNGNFATSTRQAPDFATPSRAGEFRECILELKLVADVGIIGLPNAGKSTFISAVSRSRPRVADYPFTTLIPNLGVVSLDDDRVFVVADMPGLIEGAHEGAGLGLHFLRHIERTRVLLHLVAPTFEGLAFDPVKDLVTVEHELESFHTDLLRRPRIVALNKLDTGLDPDAVAALTEHCRQRDIPLFIISAAARKGLPDLLESLWKLLIDAPAPALRSAAPLPLTTTHGDDQDDAGDPGSLLVPTEDTSAKPEEPVAPAASVWEDAFLAAQQAGEDVLVVDGRRLMKPAVAPPTEAESISVPDSVSPRPRKRKGNG